MNLVLNSNGIAISSQRNFLVHFISSDEIVGSTGVVGTSNFYDTSASFEVSGLSKEGDYAIAKYIIKNDSNGVGADISLKVTCSNYDYFKVTESIDNKKLKSGDETEVSIKIELIRTVLNDDIVASVNSVLVVNPFDEEHISGQEPESVIAGEGVSFATDSWSLIKRAVQAGNISNYNIGDTKKIIINNKEYILRIANKTVGDHCGDNDITYSQTACGFVVEFTQIVDVMSMNDTSSVLGGYPASNGYSYLNDTLYNQLPSDLKDIIKTTRVISGYGCLSGWNSTYRTCNVADNNGNNYVTYDKLFLLSGMEIFGADENDTSAVNTSQLEYYQDENNLRKKRKDGSASNWWLRSSVNYYNKSFGNVGGDGKKYTGSADNLSGISPAFRIG